MVRPGITVIICLISFSVLSGCSDSEPAFGLSNGKSVHLSQFREKIVLINYWATWCKPCREEIPELNRFAKDNREDVAVFGVNFDGLQGEALISQSKAMGIEFPVLVDDPRESLGIESSGVLPETLVLDRNGRYVKTLIGPRQAADLEALLTGDL